MTDEILLERRGPLAVVTLNRPKALNALTLPMIRAFDPVLKAWAQDPDVRAVVIRGAGDRAFCAGGDVRAAWEAGKAAKEGRGDGALTVDFFREEYVLNRRIHRFPKPYIALLDGITMGGGVGLSVHGSHRIVTEKTLFAMPETGIGLFPDVGGSYFLSRMPGQLGAFLALTGARLHAADALYTGAGTHHVPSEALDTLVAELERELAGADAPGAAVQAVVSRHAVPAGGAPLAAHREAIDRCFAFDRVEDIIAALERDGGEWAEAQLKALAHLSPTSLKISLAEVRRGATLDFDACMAMEYRMSQACMAGHDFYEGIRAVLVDKDRNPAWKPATLAEVGDDLVEAHFKTLGARELVFTD
ncbi:MAG TPA: enoyl-CoA hydratase/isomerase family protein [Azospirillaceae bacterium]|nr:enoyl-CoA hydratase/isomerase family protein [Azospirillaceae bacterium]